MDEVVTYHFWAEIDEILSQGEKDQDLALSSTDAYIKFVSIFQDEYLESEAELMHCFYKLFVSSLYQKFSDVVIERIIQLAFEKTDARELWVLYNSLFFAGNENKEVFKQMTNVQDRNFVLKLKNHICESKFGDRLQRISINLLFEICHVRLLSFNELDSIDENFLNHLLDLIEKTRDDEHETFNYSVIRLILSFNEQFMINYSEGSNHNTVSQALGDRIGNSKTFGENVIFMLNRAADHHIQMLILKLLYVVFTTPETYEYFYTNDLRVLIDVFIRELYDLPEESEPLRNVYLRVLYPLITNTQLRQHRYKQRQLLNLLLDLIGPTNQFKPISPTTQRLVDRCLITEYLKDVASPCNYSNGIKRIPTPNAMVMGIDTVRNTNSSNGNGFTVGVV